MDLFSKWALVVPAILYAGLVYTYMAFARLEPQTARASRRFPLNPSVVSPGTGQTQTAPFARPSRS